MDRSERVSTGVGGLDDILGGGLVPGRAYLAWGGPGTGKTTLGLSFLAEGQRRGESCLVVALTESEGALRRDAAAMNLDISASHVVDLTAPAEFFAQGDSYTIFSAHDVEGERCCRQIVAATERVRPQRVFVDTLSHFRWLAGNDSLFRRQVCSFLRFLAEQETTVLCTGEGSGHHDRELQFAVDGLFKLRHCQGERTLEVTKQRGSPFRPGRHELRLGGRGMQVGPRRPHGPCGKDSQDSREVLGEGGLNAH